MTSTHTLTLTGDEVLTVLAALFVARNVVSHDGAVYERYDGVHDRTGSQLVNPVVATLPDTE